MDALASVEDNHSPLWHGQKPVQNASRSSSSTNDTFENEDDCMDEAEFASWLARQHEEELKKADLNTETLPVKLIVVKDEEEASSPPFERQKTEPPLTLPDTKKDLFEKHEDDSLIWFPQKPDVKPEIPDAPEISVAQYPNPNSTYLRNPPIKFPYVRVSNFTYNGIRLSPNQCVELRNGDFMKIINIVELSWTSEVTLQGYIFRRTKEMNGILDRKLNEICWILHVDDDDPRDPLIQSVESRSVAEVLKRRSVRFTNQDFPALSFRQDAAKESEDTVCDERVLVCRYKYICHYPDAKARLAYAWSEKSLCRLRAEDCDKRLDNRVQDEALRTNWRGETSLGGSMEGWLPGEQDFLWEETKLHAGLLTPGCTSEDLISREDVGSLRYRRHFEEDEDRHSLASNNEVKTEGTFEEDLNLPEVIEVDARVKISSSLGVFDQRYTSKLTTSFTPNPSSTKKRPFDASDPDKEAPDAGRRSYDTSKVQSVDAKQRRYTFGDCFCGAGGMSRGAIDAGLRVSWGFDFDLPACQSYAKNFFATHIYNVAAHEFADSSKDHRVDIVHLSPPCQFFSPLHTKQGKDDEMNTASLFAILNLLNKTKPRVVTLEQTAGLLRRHPQYFNAVINMFTIHGFSVRWKLLTSGDYGVPQRRSRLLIIASW